MSKDEKLTGTLRRAKKMEDEACGIIGRFSEEELSYLPDRSRQSVWKTILMLKQDASIHSRALGILLKELGEQP